MVQRQASAVLLTHGGGVVDVHLGGPAQVRQDLGEEQILSICRRAGTQVRSGLGWCGPVGKRHTRARTPLQLGWGGRPPHPHPPSPCGDTPLMYLFIPFVVFLLLQLCKCAEGTGGAGANRRFHSIDHKQVYSLLTVGNVQGKPGGAGANKDIDVVVHNAHVYFNSQ